MTRSIAILILATAVHADRAFAQQANQSSVLALSVMIESEGGSRNYLATAESGLAEISSMVLRYTAYAGPEVAYDTLRDMGLTEDEADAVMLNTILTLDALDRLSVGDWHDCPNLGGQEGED